MIKNQIKYIALLLGIGLSVGFLVSAAPSVIFQPSIYPITTSTDSLGSTTRQWLSISVKNASSTVTSATTLCLSGDVCRTTWPAGGSGTPGGSDTQVQFNDATVFGGDSAFTWDKTLDKLTVTNSSTTNATLTNFWSTNGQITNASSTNLTATNFWSTNGTITNLTTTGGTITNASSTYLTVSDTAWINKLNVTNTTATSTITGGLTIGNNAALVVNSGSSANSLYIAGNGNVGIGTAGPGSLLEITSTTDDPTLTLHRNQGVADASDIGTLDFKNLGTITARIIAETEGANEDAAHLKFYTATGGSATEKVRITNTGNVGIGITVPTEKLDVAGSINIDKSSTYKINGVTVLNATTTTGNTLVGPYAGLNIIATSTASPSSGLYNTALGYEALRYATSTDYNTAVGYQALRMSSSGTANNSGAFNSAFGMQALLSNTTGNYNSAFGYAALQDNTTGERNSALGDYALESNTTGNYNSALGYAALDLTTTGSYNSALGYAALFFNTTGSNNSALGFYALYYNNSATNTIAVGYQSARGTAAYNNQGGTYLGYQAGYSAGTGSNYNTLLGYQAGYGITTGAYNIVIGQNVEAPTVAGNQQLNIGNLIYGTGIYNGGSVSSAPVSAGLVGIGTSTPQSLLHVTKTGNATTSVEFGGVGQNKGSCLVMYDVAGAVQYVRIQAGAFVIDTNSCK